MSTESKVISLWQPWAMLLALGEKKFETRHWQLPARFIGQTIYIHAATRWTAEEKEYCKILDFREAFRRHPEIVGYEVEDQIGVTYRKVYLGGDNFATLPFGCLVGTVKLTACVRTEDLTGREVSAKELAFGNYEPGRFAWIGEEHQVLPRFIPMVGRQGFFKYTPGVTNGR